MKFIDLKKSENNRNETYKKFEEQLKKFKQEYEEEFEINYYSTDELVVAIENPRDYNETIHNSLCEKFDVKLQYVYKSYTQTPKDTYNKIEFIYSPVHHYVKYLKWEDIKL